MRYRASASFVLAYPPTIVQFANAACGPPVYMAKPKSTGRPETKFIVMYVAAQLSKSPRWRKNSGNGP